MLRLDRASDVIIMAFCLHNFILEHDTDDYQSDSDDDEQADEANDNLEEELDLHNDEEIFNGQEESDWARKRDRIALLLATI